MSILETRGLTMRFGGVNAVDGVDFALREGELRCLIGPNGAGKTTFFKCLTGMLRPSDGEVLIFGRRTTGWDPHRVARLRVGIKTQVPSVMDGLSVRENVWIAARRWHDGTASESMTETCMERLEITDLADATVGRLSHGERQRVELASVLAAEPRLILLDEPAAGLTGREVAAMAELIGKLNESAALIVVEHDMQFIRQIARRVTVFVRGRVLIEDEVETVLADARVRDVYLGRQA